MVINDREAIHDQGSRLIKPLHPRGPCCEHTHIWAHVAFIYPQPGINHGCAAESKQRTATVWRAPNASKSHARILPSVQRGPEFPVCLFLSHSYGSAIYVSAHLISDDNALPLGGERNIPTHTGKFQSRNVEASWFCRRQMFNHYLKSYAYIQ